MLAITYGELQKAGLEGEESILDLSNTFYRITSGISVMVSLAGKNAKLPKCGETLAMYLTVRLAGIPRKKLEKALRILLLWLPSNRLLQGA